GAGAGAGAGGGGGAVVVGAAVVGGTVVLVVVVLDDVVVLIAGNVGAGRGAATVRGRWRASAWAPRAMSDASELAAISNHSARRKSGRLSGRPTGRVSPWLLLGQPSGILLAEHPVSHPQ